MLKNEHDLLCYLDSIGRLNKPSPALCAMDHWALALTASLHGCHLKYVVSPSMPFITSFWVKLGHCLPFFFVFVCFIPPYLSPSTSRPSAANKMSWITTSLRATRTPCLKRDGGIASLLTVNAQWPNRAPPTTTRWEFISCWRKFGLQKHWNSANLSKKILLSMHFSHYLHILMLKTTLNAIILILTWFHPYLVGSFI